MGNRIFDKIVSNPKPESSEKSTEILKEKYTPPEKSQKKC